VTLDIPTLGWQVPARYFNAQSSSEEAEIIY